MEVPVAGAYTTQVGIMSTKESSHAIEVSPGDELDNKVRSKLRKASILFARLQTTISLLTQSTPIHIFILHLEDLPITRQ